MRISLRFCLFFCNSRNVQTKDLWKKKRKLNLNSENAFVSCNFEHTNQHHTIINKGFSFLQFEAHKFIKYFPFTVNDLFMNPKLNNRSVVVFSIVGAFRKGKSFLLNYVLRYMYLNVSLIEVLTKKQFD